MLYSRIFLMFTSLLLSFNPLPSTPGFANLADIAHMRAILTVGFNLTENGGRLEILVVNVVF